MKKKKGFTLIELLVVIAVIALLLSVIMPALGKAKKLAKSMVCKTNLRSLQLGNIMFIQENDGKHLTGGSDQRVWVDQIATYIEDVDAARFCPEADERKFEPDPSNPTKIHVNGTRTKPWGLYNKELERYDIGSYTINNATYYDILWGNEPIDAGNRFRKAGMVQNAGIVPVFMDGIRFGTGADNHADFEPSRDIDWEEGSVGNGATSFGRVLINRHAGYGNMVYYDGHAEQVYLPEYFLQKWHRESTPNQTMVDRIIAENPPSKSR